MKKLAALTDIAQETGLSLMTVSRVLNAKGPECRVKAKSAQLVRDAARRLGYTPNFLAQAMKRGRTGAIGIVIHTGPGNPDKLAAPQETPLGIPYFGTIIGAIEHYSRSLGYYMSVVGPDGVNNAVERGFNCMRQRRFDGLIVFGQNAAIDQFYAGLDPGEAASAPVVAIEYNGAAKIPAVNWDDARGVALAVKHLAELGHRDVLWAGVPGTAREQLCMREVWDAGLRGASCRFDETERHLTDPSAETAAAAMRSFLREKKRTYTAIVAYNDLVAIGASRALQEAGLRIPADVSVLGYDNILAKYSYPPLTTIDHRLYEMGYRAMNMLHGLLSQAEPENSPRDRREILEPQLIVRASTGPAPRD